MSALKMTLLVIGTVSFLIPFVVWTYTRFMERAKQHFRHWHKIAVIVSFVVFEFIFVIVILILIFVVTS